MLYSKLYIVPYREREKENKTKGKNQLSICLFIIESSKWKAVPAYTSKKEGREPAQRISKEKIQKKIYFVRFFFFL